MKKFYQKFISKIGSVFLIALVFGVLSSGNAYATDDFIIGTVNLNNTHENSAKVGDVLKGPENGWKRTDDSNSSISYVGSGWGTEIDADYYKSAKHLSKNNGDSYKFNFVGSKVRIISKIIKAAVGSSSISVKIDGVVAGTFSQYGAKDIAQVLLFDQENIGEGEHYIEIINNTTNYITADAIDIVENGELKPYNKTPTNKVVLNIEPEKNKIKKNETVTANLTIDNITNIAAEDIRIKYDAEKLEFVNFAEVDGMKLVKNDAKVGELRFILASKGKNNIADAKKILLKLNFKGIKAGEALVDVVKGRVSDGIEMEKDLTDAECGQATITIEEMKDVNNSGEYTLLDLAIDGRHLGETPTTLPQYNTDIIENNEIDDADLIEIGNQMLSNQNYKF
ncbi:cohesin domain-containing protein [Clostridium estertheticum]|uniref:cohesin domain-containing protein n=1 Tax=Clostridium estertheticum TaxID=238834 RepID=UPI001CF5374C|nr:cohesin domain-containing protein [Clostridium estertheticum]MCB2354329.1 cohesin domain-containing protein [Clostridium estertheticum]WAG42552.1 cohesin domain-containing protein [Clostridium estertheticum]